MKLKILSRLENIIGFPKMYFYEETEKFNYLGLSLLGDNLEQFFKKKNYNLTLKNVFYIATQIIDRLYDFHSLGFIHRDIKPENCLISPKDGLVYLIDFGLSKKIIFDGIHIQMNSREGMIGTTRYMSTNAHKQLDQSRRDDLESLGYMLIYFIEGTLPWYFILLF